MTTDSPSTSGKGVDVLSWIRNTIARNGWQARERDEALMRVAKLMEAADIALAEYATREDIPLSIPMEHLQRQLAACRATPGAHP